MPSRSSSIGICVLATAALAFGAAGCGGGSSGVPNVSGSAATTTSGAHSDPLAFSQCMRAHGLPDFPDPDDSGTIDLKNLHPAKNSDLDPGTSGFRRALTACKALAPPTFLSHTPTPAQRAQALAFSRCMRAHGIAAFPDPDSAGRLSVSALRAAGVRAMSPQFQAAVKACGAYQPHSIHFPGGA